MLDGSPLKSWKYCCCLVVCDTHNGIIEMNDRILWSSREGLGKGLSLFGLMRGGFFQSAWFGTGS